MGRLKQLETYSTPMVEAFKSNMLKVGGHDSEEGPVGPGGCFITDEGLTQVTDLFGKVPYEMRAAVYSLFLDGLNNAGIFYDPRQLPDAHTIH